MSETPDPKRQRVHSPVHVSVSIGRDLFGTNKHSTRSHRNLSHINSLRDSFSFHSVLSYSESKMRYLTSELNELPKYTKFDIICPLFEQCTFNLSQLVAKSQVEVYSSHRMPLSEQLVYYSCTQINTVGSYGRPTLLASIEDYPEYLFTPKICNQVLSIISRVCIIFQIVSDVRKLVYLDDTSEKPPSPQQRNYSRSDFIAIQFETEPKFPRVVLRNKEGDCSGISSVIESCSVKKLDNYSHIALELINQIRIILVHPQMNIEVVIACLDLISDVNLYNHGGGTEWLSHLLRDDRMSVIFGTNNSAANAVMRFYSNVPLTNYFISYFNKELFEKFIKFIQETQKPNSTLLKSKFKLLSLLSNSTNLHDLSIQTAYASFLYKLTRNLFISHSFRDKYRTRIMSQDILLQLILLLQTLYRESPPDTDKKRKTLLRNICVGQDYQTISSVLELFQFEEFPHSHKFLSLVTEQRSEDSSD